MDFRKSKKNRIQRNVLCAIYATLIYQIWMNSNLVVWKGFVRRPQQVLCDIRTIAWDRFDILHPEFTDTVINK